MLLCFLMGQQVTLQCFLQHEILCLLKRYMYIHRTVSKAFTENLIQMLQKDAYIIFGNVPNCTIIIWLKRLRLVNSFPSQIYWFLLYFDFINLMTHVPSVRLQIRTCIQSSPMLGHIWTTLSKVQTMSWRFTCHSY